MQHVYLISCFKQLDPNIQFAWADNIKPFKMIIFKYLLSAYSKWYGIGNDCIHDQCFTYEKRNREGKVKGKMEREVEGERGREALDIVSFLP